MSEIKNEIIKRIEEHKAMVSKNILLNSHESDLDADVKCSMRPYDACIDIINQVMGDK